MKENTYSRKRRNIMEGHEENNNTPNSASFVNIQDN